MPNQATLSASAQVAATPATPAKEAYDAIIVGAGLAGLSVALQLPAHWRVALLLKGAQAECASSRAQGGIAAVMDAHDSLEHHVQDTLVAGAGLCDEHSVRHILARAPQALTWLQQQAVPFTRLADGSGLHLTREGGHSHRRIAHAADATGKAIMTSLWQRLRQCAHIRVLEHHAAIDLHTVPSPEGTPICQGVWVQDVHRARRRLLAAPRVVLASGGMGQLYPRTTNPPAATADGVAMAWRAGCAVRDLEFLQFHPTGLCTPNANGFLISEALRGEGGLLCLPDGTRFMPAHDARAELAPRDVVARAIFHEMQQHRLPFVHLDMRHKGAAFLHQHFPTILAECLRHGIDITRQPIPVAPVAHYACGGIVTDLHARTALPGLYAVGEDACTGLHGANRLASNSLLECVVMGHAAAHDMVQTNAALKDATSTVPPRPRTTAYRGWSAAQCTALRQQLTQAMWQGAGIVRNARDLRIAQKVVQAMRSQWLACPDHLSASAPLASLELRNLLDVAALLLEAALTRTQSCGLHTRSDAPATAPAPPAVGLPDTVAQAA
ncbi:L-aspartate oxidase [Lampropedia hyalina DSM 16112]|jgi:L-aspartate oxidase|uniref:L-aspartate oxidase n=1 Tax=Lampropedia hyalina DSM 16112 TaxID=1122156 RepID=A0A1M4S9D8_9BURK|nr:L-aspartate oxidase [Lampropedia hyalina]SHE28765.1 L-aspartate oxidase [Lampropedia hyalina DSM 16112]